MTIAFPTVKVEIKWSQGPDWGDWIFPATLGVSGFGSSDYTDVSADVLSVSINRGKARELEEFRSGTARVMLLNNSRQYDPDYSSGPYYGDIKPGRMLKLSLTHPTKGVETICYKGTIREFDYSYTPTGAGSGNSVVGVACSDIIYDSGNAQVSTTSTASKSGAQIGELLDIIGIADRDLDTGAHDMQATTYANANALTSIQAIAYSEGVDISTVYGSKSNQFIFEDSASLAVKTSIGTFGTSALPIHKIGLTYESDLIKNSVAFTRTGGSEQTKTDATSITDYGTRSLSKTGLVNATDGDVANLAQDAINQFKDAEFRIRNMVLKPRANADLMTKVIGMELRDKLVVEFAPPANSGSGPATGTMSQTHFIVGLKMELKNQDFTATVIMNSDTGKTGGWVLGSAVLGTSSLSW